MHACRQAVSMHVYLALSGGCGRESESLECSKLVQVLACNMHVQWLLSPEGPLQWNCLLACCRRCAWPWEWEVAGHACCMLTCKIQSNPIHVQTCVCKWAGRAGPILPCSLCSLSKALLIIYLIALSIPYNDPILTKGTHSRFDPSC